MSNKNSQDISSALLAAFETYSKSTAASVKASATIECTITGIVDRAAGIYTVKYQNNIFNVYSNNADYSIKDIVYVLVPENDFSKKKMIVGLIKHNTDESASSAEEDSTASQYLVIADNVLDINSKEVINLCSFHTETKDIFSSNVDSADQVLMPKYLKHYKTYALSMKVKTSLIDSQKVGGDYGITLQLPFFRYSEDNDKMINDKTLTFDIHKMLGNPYNYQVWTQQTYYFTLEENDEEFYDSRRSPIISAFVKDFNQDENIDTNDIFIKDVQFLVVQALTETEMQGNYLKIKSDTGEYFLKNYFETTKTLKPILKIKGQEKNINGYDCYWFVKDASVNATNNPDYCTKGGLGWKCLNEKTKVNTNDNGDTSYQYVTNMYSYQVKIEDVKTSLIYKCVLTKDTERISGELEIVNLNSDIKFSLYSTTGSNNFVKNIGKVSLAADLYYPGTTDNENSTSNFKYYWDRYAKDGTYLDSDFLTFSDINTKENGHYITKGTYPTSKMQDSNLITCTVFEEKQRADGSIESINLGSADLAVAAIDSYEYVTYLYNATRLYNYDADGDSPFSKYYDKDTVNLNEIKPITFKIYKANGNELTETEYLAVNTIWRIPKKSLININPVLISEEDDNYYYVRGERSLPYTIDATYNPSKSNNEITLYTTFAGVEMLNNTSFTFVKDGGNGTNGTNYSAEIIIDGYAYGQKNPTTNGVYKLCYVYFADSAKWMLYDMQNNQLIDDTTLMTLDVRVFSQGEVITDDTQYSVVWSMFDDKATNPCFIFDDKKNQLIPSVAFDPSEVYCNILQAEVTVTDTSVANKNWIIYAYYPIEITYCAKESDIIYTDEKGNKRCVVPVLNGGYSEVLFASDGTNPKWDNSSNFTIVDNLYSIDSSNIYDYKWETSENLTISEYRSADLPENQKVIEPTSKFDSGISKNYVKTTLTLDSATKEKLTKTKEEYTKEAEDYQTQITALTTNYSTLKNVLSYFQYKPWLNVLTEVKDYISLNNDMIRTLKESESLLSDVSKYYQQHAEIGGIVTIDFVTYNNYINRDITNALLGKTLPVSFSTRKIDLTDRQLARLKEKLDISVYNVFVNYVNIYNDKIEVVLQYKNQLIAEEGGARKYESKREKLYNLCSGDSTSAIAEGVYPVSRMISTFDTIKTAYKNSYDNLVALQNHFTEVSSYSEYSDIFENMKKTLLDYGKLSDSEENMEIKENLTNDYNEQLKLLYSSKMASITQANAYDVLIGVEMNRIIHIKPIIMLYNRYAMSNINGWDGNKIYTGDEDSFLLAPQVGAGKKDSNNKFTGMVMGLRNLNKTSAAEDTQVGLFGYSSGAQSLFLNAEDGSAIFGLHQRGQIIIDPLTSQALLYSGNFYKEFGKDGKPTNYSSQNKNNQGMQIDLTTPKIEFGSGNFIVTPEGHVTAKGGGSIAGWQIGDTTLKSSDGNVTLDSQNTKIYGHNHSTIDSTTDGFYLGPDGISIGSCFRVNQDTLLLGNLKSGSRHWELKYDADNSYLSYGTKGSISSVYVGTDAITLGRKFSVNNEGELTATLGHIGGWEIGDKSLSCDSRSASMYSGSHTTLDSTSGGFYLSSDGFSLGRHFKVDDDGLLTASDISVSGRIEASSGSIGNFDISDGHISTNGKTWDGEDNDRDGVYIGSEGIYLGANFWVDVEGNLHASNATITGNVTANSIDFDTASISGTLSAGHINCQGVVDAATIYCDAANVTGTLKASQIDTDGLEIGALYGEGGSLSITGDGFVFTHTSGGTGCRLSNAGSGGNFYAKTIDATLFSVDGDSGLIAGSFTIDGVTYTIKAGLITNMTTTKAKPEED